MPLESMGMDLYYDDLSEFCTSVILLARTLGLELKLKERDTDRKEQLAPEFIQVCLKKTFLSNALKQNKGVSINRSISLFILYLFVA